MMTFCLVDATNTSRVRWPNACIDRLQFGRRSFATLKCLGLALHELVHRDVAILVRVLD